MLFYTNVWCVLSRFANPSTSTYFKKENTLYTSHFVFPNSCKEVT